MLPSMLPKQHNFTAVSFNLNNNSKGVVDEPNANPQFKQKIEKNKQLLMMMLKLQKVQESLWGKFFRFEKTQTFLDFEKRYTFKQVFRLRIDDILYFIMLAAICMVFALLPSETTLSSTFGTLLVSAYRYMIGFLLVFSALWLISTNGYRHLIFFMICVIFPLITLLTYMGVVPGGQIDTSTSIFYYLHILSLWVVYAALYIVYPIKQFVRNKIGSLYSYLYALSTLTLFLIWPAYSLVGQLTISQQITFNFITQNKALIIAFLTIVVFTFHILTHQTFFEGNLSEIKRLLLKQFKKFELAQALEKVSISEAIKTMHRIEENKGSFLVHNFNIYTRIMSLLVFAFTLAIEIYVFIYLANNLSQIYRGIVMMIYCVGFLIYGCIMNLLPISRQSVLYFFSLASLVPAAFSPLYCSACSTNPLTFYQYIFIATALPYTTIFWSVIRSLSRRRPFLKTNMLVILYIFVHIPLTLFMINNLGMISDDASIVTIVNIVLLAIVAFVSVLGIVIFVLWLCFSVGELPKQKRDGAPVPVDYNYFEQGNPAYTPYVKKQSFSLNYLSKLDIRNLAQLFNCIAFILSQLATMYFFNELNTTYSSVALTSQTTRYIIYAQFVCTFAFFTYAYSYIVFKSGQFKNTFVLICLFALGTFGIVFSFINSASYILSFKIGGGVIFVIFCSGIGLNIIKSNNKDIMSFLSGVLVISLWIFLYLPYVIALPIVSIFISTEYFGEFVSTCILGTALLMIVLVSVLSIVFNMLMNKFEQEKKVKFIMEDVQTFLKQEGVETQDEVLHVLHESFEHRDEKYVFFMKRGFPIRVFKQSKEDQTVHKTVVYNNDILIKKQSMKNIEDQDVAVDYCWSCLTFFCGVDQNETQQRIQKVAGQNMMDDDEMHQLVPEQFFKNVFLKAHQNKETINEKKYVDLTKLFSSKTIILRHLTQSNQHLGEQFSILKTKKNKKLANQIWHLIFDFLANEDDGSPKIIFNDFLIFCSIIDSTSLSQNDVNSIYLDFCTNNWKGNVAMDLSDFSVIIEELTRLKFQKLVPSEDNKYKFLMDVVYPRLCSYAEFKDVMNERTIKSTKLPRNNHYQSRTTENDASDGFGKPGSAQRSLTKQNLHSLGDNILQNSPFLDSFQRHQRKSQKLVERREKMNEKRLLKDVDKLIQPAREQVIERKQKKQEKIKEKSCKLVIYEKYQSCKNCCKKIEQQQKVIKRKVVKPWQYLAVESIRIMEHKDEEWKDQKKQKQYELRCILNNILIAVFKIADLYTYMEITIMNPQIGWQSVQQFSILTLQYRVQLYISFALVLVCAGLGIKGIGYIFEDRLGLTETRIPASFPHPMFFFTFLYKLLILSLFNTIIMTLLSTFMCDWTSSNTSFWMILSSTDVPLQCFSSEHNIYIVCSLVAIILYYPLSAYTMPNFQFAEKRLDLKYKPSYLIIFFQVNFVLAAGKVLLSQMTSKTQDIQVVQVLFQSINIFCLALLALMVIILKPCLISWFNIIQFLVIEIGLVWNILGLVLYLTGQWLICIIVGSATSVVSMVLAVVVIRKKYFSAVRVEEQMAANDLHELELAWKYRKQYNFDLVRFEKNRQQKSKVNGVSIDQEQKIMENGGHGQVKKEAKQQDAKTNYASNQILKPKVELLDGN